IKTKQTKINEIRKHDFRFEVANLITEARYHYKLTQVQLAKKVGTQQPSIARIESGSTLPSLSFLERLADSLGAYRKEIFSFALTSGNNLDSFATTPQVMKSIATWINGQVENYEKQFGEID